MVDDSLIHGRPTENVKRLIERPGARIFSRYAQQPVAGLRSAERGGQGRAGQGRLLLLRES